VTRYSLRQLHEGMRPKICLLLNQIRGELMVSKCVGDVSRLVNEGDESV
jgi:hypothetical protein